MGQIRIWHNLNFKKGRIKGLNSKNGKRSKEMGFLFMAKQGLRKIWILKDQMGLICEGRKP